MDVHVVENPRCPYCEDFIPTDVEDEIKHMNTMHPEVVAKRLRAAGMHVEADDFDRTNNPVNHPNHYGGGDNPYEAIKVIEAWELGFCLGNTVKYISRAGKKGDEIEDLKKAEWYLRRHIQQLEAERGT